MGTLLHVGGSHTSLIQALLQQLRAWGHSVEVVEELTEEVSRLGMDIFVLQMRDLLRDAHNLYCYIPLTEVTYHKFQATGERQVSPSTRPTLDGAKLEYG